MRRIFTVLSIFILTVAFAIPVAFAKGPNQNVGLGKQNKSLSNDNASNSGKLTDRLTRAKAVADKLIDTRISSLNNLLKRVQTDKRLTNEEKTSLTTDINNAITELTNLKAKIDADTTVDDVKTDAKKIFTDYRVYAIFEPKERLLVVIDNLTTLDSTVSATLSRVQTKLNDAKAAGTDTTKAQAALDDATAKTASISSQLTTDKNLVMAVSLTSQNAKTTFTQVRKDLATVRQEFAKIRMDIAQMREVIGGNGSGNDGSATGSGGLKNNVHKPSSHPTGVAEPSEPPETQTP